MQRNMASGALSMSDMNTARSGFRQSIASMSQLAVQGVRARSETSLLTEALAKQDLTMKQSMRVRKQFNNLLKEQYQLQRAAAVQWTASAAGRSTADLIIPQGASERVDRYTQSLAANSRGLISNVRNSALLSEAWSVMRTRIGLASAAMVASSNGMIKWGKNTQWAGRQLMVGFTIPLMAFGAVAGKAAYDVDTAMTRIAKVYDTTSTTVVGKQREMDALRVESMNMAMQVAKRYGQSIKDTLEIEADLAATGLKGQQLQQSTVAVTRAATLGELDRQNAIKATIALQSVYGDSAEQLTKDFNYMNAIENATSLSMQDFIDAIPRGAGVMKNMGVNLKEMGVILVALKQNGIGATEGMNGMRSAAQRLLMITPKAEETWSRLLPDAGKLQSIVQVNKGEFIPTLQAMGQAMKNLEPYEQQEIIARVFGVYQANKIYAVLNGLINKTGQVATAYDVMAQSSAKNSATAQSELDRLANSASGKFKRALETIKAQLAVVGEPFLEVGAKILGFIKTLFDMFNSMPDVVKKTLAALVIGGAILGPIVMLIGLFANLGGQILKLGGFLVGLLSRFRPLTLEQKAQQMLANQSSLAWNNQGQAAQALAGQLAILTTQMERVAIANMRMAGMPITRLGNPAASSAVIGGIGPTAPTGTGPYAVNSAGRNYNTSTGRLVSQREVNAYAAAQAAAARSSAATAASTAATRRDWGKIGMAVGGVGIVATTFAAASGSSSQMLNNIVNMVFAASLLGPALIAAFRNSALAGAMANVTAAFGFGRGVAAAGGAGAAGRLGAGLTAALIPAGRLVMLFMKFAGPVGLLVTAGYLMVKLWRNMKDGIETQKKINASAKDWASILGFVYSEAGEIKDKNGEIVSTIDAQVTKLKDKNKQLVRSLQLAKQNGDEQKAINLAIAEGLKVANHGGSAEDATSATKISLRAAGYSSQQIETLMVKVKAQVDFTDAKSTLGRQMDEFKSQFNKIANNKFGQGTWEGFTRAFSGRGEINQNAAERGKGMANEFWTGFQKESDMKSRRDYFDKFFKSVGQEQHEAWGRLGNANRADLKKAGIESWEEFARAYTDSQKMSSVEFTKAWGNGDIEQADKVRSALNGLGKDTTLYAQKHIDAEKLIAQAIAKKNNMSDEEVSKVLTLSDLYGKLDMATMSVADAEKAYTTALVNQDIALMKKSKAAREEQELKILNTYRIAAGLKETKNLEDGFGAATDKSTGKLLENANALADATLEIDDYNNARREAMQGAQDYALQAADDIWQERADAEVSAIEERGERREDALDAAAEAQDKRFDARSDAADKRFDKRAKNLDKRWDVIMDNFDDRWDKRIQKEEDGYNKRIQNIKDAIAAEEKAEEQRQKIFEAEQTRLQRMAEMANQRIDFNVALNTGNLDEAAKLANNMQSTQDSWILGDAADSSQTSSEARKAGMEGKITSIEEARDKRIEALKKVEEAEKAALEAKKEREEEALAAERERYTKALEAERERYRKGIEAQKNAIQEQTARDSAAKRRELDRAKRTLELELLAVRASIPRNKAEYDKQIKTIEGLYRKYGVNLKAQGNGWSKTIGDGLTAHLKEASADLKNEINWKAIAGQITQKMIDGGFGMTTSEFMKWVTTGQLPKNYKAPGSAAADRNKNYAGNSVTGARHTGGPVNGSSKYDNRGGRNWGTSMRRDEKMMLLKNNEYVINEKAHKTLGTDFLDGVNGGKYGIGGPMGMTGMFAAGLVGAYNAASSMAVNAAGNNAMAFGVDGTGIPGAAGKYANVSLNSEQLRNAARIIAVGKSLGASTRDNVIAIMTAMQESTLRNLTYGDRDSVGLFQQRNAWGSFADRTNPEKSARMFFLGGKAGQRGLFDFKNRNKMSLAQAAQAVQVSAFPDAYAKWQAMAQQVVSKTGFEPFSGIAAGAGGWRKPVAGPVTQEWNKRHGGIDIGVPTGTPVRAANSGTVVTSADLPGNGNGGYRSYGRYIVVDHGDKSTLYAHLSRRSLTAGSNVNSGQVLGLSGNTGNSTGPHLHFETRGPGGFPGFNPRSIIPGLESGGFTLSDGLAMLHKKETVLTAPLSEQLKSGIQKIDQGVNNQYNVSVDLRGAYIREELDIEKAFNAAIEKRESRLGRNRKIK